MPRWTPEARLKHAAAIRRWMPWTLSTGPVTAEGKARSSRNAWKGGLRPQVSNWHRALRQIGLITERLYSSIRPKQHVHRREAPVPSPGFWNAFEDWDADSNEDDEPDAIDRMSSADLEVAMHRLLAGRPALIAA